MAGPTQIPPVTHNPFDLRTLWSQSLLPHRKHAAATGDQGCIVAKRDRLRDFNLVTDARGGTQVPSCFLRFQAILTAD